ncbi:hypothetical protein HPB47_017853 [Ixodes persulcatus]|uniref:Uncharacterized protein n=1 Tax=Ixodes persulcatus TaxID=34615 RepID=A0AC60QPU4_IXOPE|nr:hypothetical protein HPB47_017853 [Ixodes persulcatus]
MKPDVIAVQETWGMAKLSGYRAYCKDAKEKTPVTMLVRRNLPVIEHDTGISTVEHVLIEIKSNTKRDGRSVFVHNVYSSPAQRHRFAALFRATLEVAKQQALVGVGGFNAPHPDWGISREFEEEDIENIEEWTEKLRACAEHATKTVPGEANVQTAESKLLHTWEAKSSMQTRLRIQRHNRNLRCKISKSSKEIEAHANKITRQQWQDSCDGFDHKLGAPKTWNILRHLLDPDGTKAAQKNKMSEILRRNEGTEDDLVEEILKRYIEDSPLRAPTEYDGERSAALDVPITEAEVREVLLRLKTKSAPGPDWVTNNMLRNLGDGAVTGITRYTNACWKLEDRHPQAGQEAAAGLPETHFVNLLRRKAHGARRPREADQVIGREGALSAHHGRLSGRICPLRHQTVDGTGSSPLDTRVILGLDLTKAFNNIIHDAVFDNLGALAVGKRRYEYIQDFMSGRKSEDICLGGKGTPQGSVLSPYLFNKSELLLLRPKRGGKEKSNFELFAQGHRIPQIESIRVLGRRIQADGKNREIIKALRGTAYQVARLIPWISNRNYGIKEGNHMSLVEAFVMSRLAYEVPFMRLGVAEKFKLKCIVRKAYKRALGLPDSTSNEKLAALRVQNTIDELIEAQRTAQLERLTRSATGRHILKSLGLRYETQRGEKVDVPHTHQGDGADFPHPKAHASCTQCQEKGGEGQTLGRTLKEEEGVTYVDAAEYKGRGAMAAAVVNGDGHLVASCSVKTDDPETAEEVEGALALRIPGVRTIVCDSQSSVCNFAKGRVSPKTLRVLRGATCFSERERVRLVWTPAHAPLPGNEEAHDGARGLTVRAGTTSGAPVTSSGRDRLVTFRDILDHYTDGRARFPPAHHSLNKRHLDPRVQEDLVRLAENAAGVQGVLAVV